MSRVTKGSVHSSMMGSNKETNFFLTSGDDVSINITEITEIADRLSKKCDVDVSKLDHNTKKDVDRLSSVINKMYGTPEYKNIYENILSSFRKCNGKCREGTVGSLFQECVNRNGMEMGCDINCINSLMKNPEYKPCSNQIIVFKGNEAVVVASGNPQNHTIVYVKHNFITPAQCKKLESMGVTKIKVFYIDNNGVSHPLYRGDIICVTEFKPNDTGSYWLWILIAAIIILIVMAAVVALNYKK